MSKLKLWKQDPFGHALWIKKLIIRTLGMLTHRRYRGFNNLHIEGSEIIRSLPKRGVLFISNHQTYFADVIAMYHVFNASLKGEGQFSKKYRLCLETQIEHILCRCFRDNARWLITQNISLCRCCTSEPYLEREREGNPSRGKSR